MVKNKIIFFDENNKYFKVGNKTFIVKGGIKKLIENKKKIGEVIIQIVINKIKKKIFES